MADIIELTLAEHRRIRRLEAGLREAARLCGSEPSWVLPRAWDRLAEVIEAHTTAEEEICWSAVSGADLVQLAELAADGEDIREAIAEAALQSAGSLCWWRAVNDALRACSACLDREERGLLDGFARHADPALRDQLGRQWLAFRAARSRDAARPSGTGRPSAAGPAVPGPDPAALRDAERWRAHRRRSTPAPASGGHQRGQALGERAAASASPYPRRNPSRNDPSRSMGQAEPAASGEPRDTASHLYRATI